MLTWMFSVLVQTVKLETPGKLVWLGETSSAYGGGAVGLSDTFVAGFMWVHASQDSGVKRNEGQRDLHREQEQEVSHHKFKFLEKHNIETDSGLSHVDT